MTERHFEHSREDDNYDFGNESSKERYQAALKKQRDQAAETPFADLQKNNPEPGLPFEESDGQTGIGSPHWEELKRRLGSDKNKGNKKIA